MKELQEIIADLLVVAQSFTGHALPVVPPEVEFVPQTHLQEVACDRPCQIYGWFPPGRTIYLDKRLDPINDVRARGILLHELTHYLQQEAGAYTEATPCVNWGAREREAYRVQSLWLAEQRVEFTGVAGYRIAPWNLACRQDSGKDEDENADQSPFP